MSARLGDRVLYRVHKEHHTSLHEPVMRDGKQVMEDYEEEQFVEDGDKKIPRLKADGSPLTKTKQRPLMQHVSDGSIHHPAMREFVAIVGRVRTEPRTAERDAHVVYDLLLLVPNREPRWVDGVEEGDLDHEFKPGPDSFDVTAYLNFRLQAVLDRLAKLETPSSATPAIPSQGEQQAA